MKTNELCACDWKADVSNAQH